MEAKLRVYGSWQTTNDDSLTTRFNLRIEDDLSGERVADFLVDAETWAALVRGSSVTINGEVIQPYQARRLGLKMENDSRDVPREAIKGSHSPLPQIEAWADQIATAEGWDDYDAPRKTNRGTWCVVFRRWVRADTGKPVPDALAILHRKAEDAARRNDDVRMACYRDAIAVVEARPWIAEGGQS